MYRLQIIMPNETITSDHAYKTLNTVVRHAEKALKEIQHDVFPNGKIPYGAYFSNSRMFLFKSAWNGMYGVQNFEWSYDYNSPDKYHGKIKILAE